MELQFSCVKCGKFLGYYTGRAFFIETTPHSNIDAKILCCKCYQEKLKEGS